MVSLIRRVTNVFVKNDGLDPFVVCISEYECLVFNYCMSNFC